MQAKNDSRATRSEVFELIGRQGPRLDTTFLYKIKAYRRTTSAPSSWGIQVADYGLWAAQRIIEERECPWFQPYVKPHLRSFFTPWGRA
jgi:hypothetical protein